MKLFAIVLLLLVSVIGVSQNENQKQEKVIETIEVFFAGFHAQDSALIKSVVFKDAIMQSISRNKEAIVTLTTSSFEDFLNQIIAIPETDTFFESLISYSVQIDGNMANVWTPYEFWYNDQKSHCGVNSFQLIKDNETWKIIYIIDTRRQCKE